MSRRFQSINKIKSNKRKEKKSSAAIILLRQNNYKSDSIYRYFLIGHEQYGEQIVALKQPHDHQMLWMINYSLGG